LNIEAGVRYNFIQINITDNTLGNIVVKPSAFVYNTGINYQINKYHQVYSSIASGYRAPNIDDMGTLGIVDFRYEVPAYDLKPEKSINTEIGYKYASKKILLNLSVYHMNLKDIIARVKVDGQIINGYTVYNKKNIESSYIQGVEMNLNYQIGNTFWFSSNANYTYGQNRTKNEPMRRIPPFFGQHKLEWNYQRVQLAFSHQYAGKQDRLAQGDKDDNRIGKLGTPQWNTFNLEGTYQKGSLTFKMGLINILNEKYKTHGSGIYGMGRALSTSLQWRF
jgi:outer membrane receptor protein involved in Fe transport